jgi:hypothetical protein
MPGQRPNIRANVGRPLEVLAPRPWAAFRAPLMAFWRRAGAEACATVLESIISPVACTTGSIPRMVADREQARRRGRYRLLNSS